MTRKSHKNIQKMPKGIQKGEKMEKIISNKMHKKNCNYVLTFRQGEDQN